MPSDERVALPPGIFTILSSETTPRAVTSPTNEGESLYVSSTSSALGQQWLISGNGVCRSMADSTEYAYVAVPSAENASVTQKKTERQWIVNVVRNFDGTWTGWIMTDDTKSCYWALNGKYVILQKDSPVYWSFQQIGKLGPASYSHDEIYSFSTKDKSKDITFRNSDDYVPQVFLGLNWLNVATGKSSDNYKINVLALATTITKTNWKFDFTSSTALTKVGVTSFKVAQADSLFQSGVYKTPSKDKNSNVSEHITFGTPFKCQPKVVLFMVGFEIGDNWRLKVYTSNVDLWGFDLHVDKWGSTDFYAATVTWIAFPSDAKGIWGESFTSEYTNKYEGTCNFPKGVFSTAPQVFAGFTQFDLNSYYSFDMQVKVDNISTSSMGWSIVRGTPKNVYVAGGAYLALEL